MSWRGRKLIRSILTYSCSPAPYLGADGCHGHFASVTSRWSPFFPPLTTEEPFKHAVPDVDPTCWKQHTYVCIALHKYNLTTVLRNMDFRARILVLAEWRGGGGVWEFSRQMDYFGSVDLYSIRRTRGNRPRSVEQNGHGKTAWLEETFNNWPFPCLHGGILLYVWSHFLPKMPQ